MAQYRSYASPSGFKPLQVADTSSKILAEGQRQMAAMQRAHQFDTSEKERVFSAMVQNQNMEAQNRDLIFRRDMENRQRIAGVIKQNYDTQIRSAVVEGENRAKLFEQLGAFSGAAIEGAIKIREKIKEADQLAFDKAVEASGGLPLPLQKSFQELNNNYTEQAIRENQYLNSLIQNGASIQNLQYLAANNSSSKWVNSRAAAESVGGSYQAFLSEARTKQYDLGGGNLKSLDEVTNVDPAARQQILSIIQSEFLRESGALNYSSAARDAYIYPAIRAVNNGEVQRGNAQQRETLAAEAQSTTFRALEQTVTDGGGEAFARQLDQMPAGAQRAELKANILKFLQNGAGSADHERYKLAFEQLLNSQVTINGETKTFGEWNKSDPRVINVANSFIEAGEREKQRIIRESQESIVQRNLAEADIISKLNQLPGGYTDADLDAAEETLDSIAPGMDSSRLDSMRKNNSTNAKGRIALEKQLTELADAGMLTTETLDQLGVPGTMRGRWQQIAEATSKTMRDNNGYKPQMDALKNLVQGLPEIQAKPDGTYNWTVPIKIAQLQNQFLSKVAQLQAAGDANAVQNSFNFVRQNFEAQVSQKGAISSSQGTMGAFTDILSQAKPNNAATARMQWIQGNISRLGSKALDSNGAIYTISELNEIKAELAKPGGKMDPMAVYLGRQFGVNPLAIINRQLKAAGEDIIEIPQTLMNFGNTVNPEVRRMLDAYRTPAISSRAMASTGEFNEGLVPKGYGPMVSSAAQKAGISPTFVAAMAEIESTWNPNAGSSAGAIGLMQIHLDSHPGYTGGADPQANLDYGAKYLAQLIKKYGDPVKAAGAYNSGPGRFDEYLKNGRPLPQETVNHMKKFSKALAKYGDVSQLRSTTTMRNSFAVRQYVSGDPAIQGMDTSSVIYDPIGHGGQAYHNHYEFATKEQAAAAKKLYESKGYRVTSYVRPGDPGAHGKGYAIDVAPPLDLPYSKEAEARWSAEANAVIGYNPLQR